MSWTRLDDGACWQHHFRAPRSGKPVFARMISWLVGKATFRKEGSAAGSRSGGLAGLPDGEARTMPGFLCYFFCMRKKTVIRLYLFFLLAIVVACVSGTIFGLRMPSIVCVKNDSGVALKHLSIKTLPNEYTRDSLAPGEEWSVRVEPEDTQEVVVQLDWNGSMRRVQCGGIDRFGEYRGIIVGPDAKYADVNFDPTGHTRERLEFE